MVSTLLLLSLLRFLVIRADLTDDEASKLGLKNEKEEVEKFISANTQELGKVCF